MRNKRLWILLSMLLALSALMGWRLAGLPLTLPDGAETDALSLSDLLPGQPSVEMALETTPASGVEKAGERADSRGSESSSKEDARNQDPAWQALERIWEASAEDMPVMAERLLAESLAGDAHAAELLLDLRIKCVGGAEPYVARPMEERLEAKRIIYRWWHPQGDPVEESDWDDPAAVFATDEKNRANLERWDRACRQFASLFSRSFREQLDTMAQQGHVVARFLYAMWPPQYLPMTERNLSLREHIEWEEKAFRYSAQNLQDGELLGLLAFLWAYDQTGFGPYDEFIRNGFWAAALACGHEGWAHDRIRTVADVIRGKPAFLADWDQHQEKLRELAEALASFCR